MDPPIIILLLMNILIIQAIDVRNSSNPKIGICAVNGNFYIENEHFASGDDDCVGCICTDSGIDCDATKCQKVPISDVESPIALIKRPDLIRNMPQSQNNLNNSPPSDEDVQEYQNFTTSLLQHRDVLTKILVDFEYIAFQLVSQYSAIDLEKFVDIKNACWKFILDGLTYALASGCISEGINYQVNDLFEKRLVSSQDELNKTVIYSSNLLVLNNSTLKQEANTIAYSLKVTKTDTVSINKTSDIQFQTKIKNVGGTNFEFDIFNRSSHTQTQSRSIIIIISAPSQKISLDPNTKLNVTFNFYQYYDVSNYFLDFIIDDNSSMISLPNYKDDVYYGDPTCCKPCMLFKQANTISSPLGSFLRKNPEFLNKVEYTNDTAVKLEEKNGQFILRNIPATEKIMNFGVDVVIGDAESI